MRLRVIVIVCLWASSFVWAQTSTVIDSKGTLQSVTSNSVTTATTAPAAPVAADIWVDNTDPNNPEVNLHDGTAWFRLDPAVMVVAAGRVFGNGTTPRPPYNATVTRTAVGTYDINFTSPRPNINYTILLTLLSAGAGNDDFGIAYDTTVATGFRVRVGDNDNGGGDRIATDHEFEFVVYDY